MHTPISISSNRYFFSSYLNSISESVMRRTCGKSFQNLHSEARMLIGPPLFMGIWTSLASWSLEDVKNWILLVEMCFNACVPSGLLIIESKFRILFLLQMSAVSFVFFIYH